MGEVVPARQQSGGQRPVHDVAQRSASPAVGVLVVDASLQHVVGELTHEGRSPAVPPRAVVRRADLPQRVVRQSGLAHAAGAYELVERAETLFERRRRVGLVEVADVDGVGPQPSQALCDGRADPCGCEPTLRLTTHADLGGDEDLLADVAQGVTEHRLRGAVGVAVRGVEGDDSSVERGAHHCCRVLRADLGPERARPELEARDLER